MSAEFTFYMSSVSAIEPVTLTTSQVFTVTNTGDEVGVDLGFYLREASSLGDIDYPSIDAPSINYQDTITQGNQGYGLTITQGAITTRFISNVGDRVDTKIPLTLGTGTNFNQLEVGSTIEITLTLTFEPTTDSKSFYIDLILE